MSSDALMPFLQNISRQLRDFVSLTTQQQLFASRSLVFNLGPYMSLSFVIESPLEHTPYLTVETKMMNKRVPWTEPKYVLEAFKAVVNELKRVPFVFEPTVKVRCYRHGTARIEPGLAEEHTVPLDECLSA